MQRTRGRTAFAATAIALAALLAWGAGLALAATEKDVAKVEVGMNRDEVLKIMGKPDRDQKVRDVENLCRLYAYKKVGDYKLVNIWFDCDDKVDAIDKIR